MVAAPSNRPEPATSETVPVMLPLTTASVEVITPLVILTVEPKRLKVPLMVADQFASSV